MNIRGMFHSLQIEFSNWVIEYYKICVLDSFLLNNSDIICVMIFEGTKIILQPRNIVNCRDNLFM